MSYYHFKKLHHRVAEIVHHRATSGDRTHLLFWSRWKPTAGGDHGVGCCLCCWLCCARSFFYVCMMLCAACCLVLCTKWRRWLNFLNNSTSLELACLTVGLMGFLVVFYQVITGYWEFYPITSNLGQLNFLLVQIFIIWNFRLRLTLFPQNWRTTPTISEKLTVEYCKIGELLPQLAKNPRVW